MEINAKFVVAVCVLAILCACGGAPAQPTNAPLAATSTSAAKATDVPTSPTSTAQPKPTEAPKPADTATPTPTPKAEKMTVEQIVANEAKLDELSPNRKEVNQAGLKDLIAQIQKGVLEVSGNKVSVEVKYQKASAKYKMAFVTLGSPTDSLVKFGTMTDAQADLSGQSANYFDQLRRELGINLPGNIEDDSTNVYMQVVADADLMRVLSGLNAVPYWHEDIHSSEWVLQYQGNTVKILMYGYETYGIWKFNNFHQTFSNLSEPIRGFGRMEAIRKDMVDVYNSLTKFKDRRGQCYWK